MTHSSTQWEYLIFTPWEYSTPIHESVLLGMAPSCEFDAVHVDISISFLEAVIHSQ